MSSRPPSVAHVNAIGTAVPTHDIHAAFATWAEARMAEGRDRQLFARMAARSGIAHRWSVLPSTAAGGSPVEPDGFYAQGFPGTAARMALYARYAPDLALDAIAALDIDHSAITHLVVASCTGFVAPGIDQIIARRLGLAHDVERLLIGFMGCYAAVTALRSARHIVRSDPDARVLVVTVELSTLHLTDRADIESLLAMLQFGDGAAAALVTASPTGFMLGDGIAATLPGSEELITWQIGDAGFEMALSGEVPGRLAEALAEPALIDAITGGAGATAIDGWAIHAGGRSILDAVARALDLHGNALDASRDVLARFGNMSSATLMFVLARLLKGPRIERGVALAFGPGLAAEGLSFASAP